MLIVHVEFETTPEARDTALAALRGEAPMVREMPGNLGYDIRIDPDRGGCVTLFHQWQDEAAFDAYRTSPGLARVGAAVRPLMIGTPSTRLYMPVPPDAEG